jgi:hypothetical protein
MPIVLLLLLLVASSAVQLRVTAKSALAPILQHSAPVVNESTQCRDTRLRCSTGVQL